MELSKICISDADALVKICNAGYVRILGLLFEKVYIPEDVVCISHWEYIHLCIAANKFSFEDGQAIFEKINSMVRYPITVYIVRRESVGVMLIYIFRSRCY